jgi:uncharacterized surface protein with fasciclin (FAS1) repeats
MKTSMQRLMAALAASILLLVTAVSPAAEKKSIVETAVAAGSFKTLAAALGAAELVDALKGAGPFTVFAPTDEAFEKLPAGTVETLLKPENKEQLIAILKYHVVAGSTPAKTVVGLKGAPTLNGQRVSISVENGSVSVDKAKVVKTDIECSNGIIHVIDSVILPVNDNIVTVATNAGSFKTLLAAAQAAGLAEALAGKGPLTVFAPTDEAFAKLPAGTVESLLKPENKAKLVAILKYHVVSGRVFSEQAVAAQKAETLQGDTVKISVTGGKAKVNDANLVATDINASNGVIHVIDSVILPPEKKKVSAHEMRKMIEQVVAKGTKTFNAGHHEACADLYTKTMREMMDYSDELPNDLVSSMKQVMTHAENTHCPTERSWTLRRGLDRAYARMAKIN